MSIFIRNPITRLKNILQPSAIKSLYTIFFISLIAGIFEILGIASIIPFINIISDPDYVISNSYMLEIVMYLDLDPRESKILVGVSVLFIFICINLFNIFALRRTLYFIAGVEYNVASSALNYYLNRPYGSFVNASPGVMTKHILEDASSLGSVIIYPLIQIISKSIIIFFISMLLIIIDYKIFLSSFFILTIIYIIIYKNFSSIVKKSGEERLILNDFRFKITRDAFNSLKEVKFYSLEDYYFKSFSKSAKDFALIDARISYLSSIPKYILETIMFGIIFSSIIYLIFIDSPLTIHFPVIGVFILAAYRAVPMIQNVYTNINSYKLYSPAFNLLEDMFTAIDATDIIQKSNMIKFDIKDQISFDNITFGYPENDSFIKDLTFKIKANSMTSIIGKTGQGKTTLIDMLLGFYKPRSGEIKIDNVILTDANRNSFNKIVGYVPQTVNLQEGSLSSNIALGIENNFVDQAYLTKIIKILKLTDLVNTLDKGIESNIGDRGIKLSGGQRQRIGIARALYLKPKILALDESTNELDSKTENEIINAIRKEFPFITIIMITHRLSSLKLADNVVLLKNNSMENIDMSDITNIKKLEQLINTDSEFEK